MNIKAMLEPLSARLKQWHLALQVWVLSDKRALRGLSVTRILIGITMLGILLSNFSARHVLWGPGSFWTEIYREESSFGRVVRVLETESPALFTLAYLILIAIAVCVIIGWRTRPMTLLLALGMASLVERAPSVGDQGDNIARIGLLLMVLMNTSEYWSLDARRRRTGRGLFEPSVLQRLRFSLPVVPQWVSTMIHNAALIALACQIFILYTASALFKVQGSQWQDGTALYYPLQLHEYGVFPWLNELIVANPFVLTTMTYFSIYVQLFFAVGLLHPMTRRLFLLGIIALHGGIAVLMGLPWFSLAMLAFDAIFVSDRTWRRIELVILRGRGGLRRRVGAVRARRREESSGLSSFPARARTPRRLRGQQPV
ncbi:HTTM domain-containing protein [Nesterenkonia muleiensis]|uniref:HTTM domain-containing protein n=1 Tax=Nesterenkonia muleiensis TaxID=2282648 RepID=UPI000E754865|nr:HTTM domain-containing protein [Nesterenkonia muleiensis]